MRVLHILNELKPSGAETMLFAAAMTFKESGFESDILSIGNQPGVFAKKLAQAGYGIHHIPFKKSLIFFVAFYKLIAGNYHSIHLHTERANFWLGLLARLATRGSVLRTIHNNFAFNGALRWRRGLQRRLLAMLGVQHISIGESVKRNERERFGLETKLIPNWYDSCKFRMPTKEEYQVARAKLNIPSGLNVIVSIGNCSDVKNHAAIIESLAMFDTKCRPLYLHVGIEDQEGGEKQLAQDLGVEDWVVFLGPLDDVRPALFAADAYVMPSLYEGFGIAAVEAIATGLPAILSDVPGLRDFGNRTSSVLYAKPNAISMAQTITELFEIPLEVRRKIGTQASIDMARFYGINVGVTKYMALYRGEVNAD